MTPIPSTVAGRALLDELVNRAGKPADRLLCEQILAIEAEAHRSAPIDNAHPLIRALADLPRHADKPGEDYIKRGGALQVAIDYLYEELESHDAE